MQRQLTKIYPSIVDPLTKFDTKYANDLIQLSRIMTKLLGGTHFCIAGGAIRDLLLKRSPRDIDVFLLQKDNSLPGNFYHEVNDNFGPAPIGTVSSADECLATFTWNDYVVQICSVEEGSTIATLLQGFDFEECMFALTPAGEVYTLCGNWWTMDYGKGHLISYNPKNRGIKSKHCVKSMKRLFRFTERYGWAYTPQTINLIAKQVVEETSWTI